MTYLCAYICVFWPQFFANYQPLKEQLEGLLLAHKKFSFQVYIQYCMNRTNLLKREQRHIDGLWTVVYSWIVNRALLLKCEQYHLADKWTEPHVGMWTLPYVWNVNCTFCSNVNSVAMLECGQCHIAKMWTVLYCSAVVLTMSYIRKAYRVIFLSTQCRCHFGRAWIVP